MLQEGRIPRYSTYPTGSLAPSNRAEIRPPQAVINYQINTSFCPTGIQQTKGKCRSEIKRAEPTLHKVRGGQMLPDPYVIDCDFPSRRPGSLYHGRNSPSFHSLKLSLQGISRQQFRPSASGLPLPNYILPVDFTAFILIRKGLIYTWFRDWKRHEIP